MSTELATIIESYSNEKLIGILLNERSQYTEEALLLVQNEANKRGISNEEIEKHRAAAPVEYNRDDFLPFDHVFSQTDILLARAMLVEHGMPFFVDTPTTSGALPMEALAETSFGIHVHRDFADAAHKLLDEHFSRDGGAYRMKELSTKDQLRLMNFYEIKLDAKQMQERVDVELSDHERRTIATYAKRLVADADRLEQEQERTVFFYDSLEDLVEKLAKSGAVAWTVADILAMLEVVQVYCDDPAFPDSMDQTIRGLLDFCRAIAES